MEPIDDLYLEWLYSLVASTRLRSPSKTYWSLLRQLYCKEFIWLVPNDDNRAEDGRDLRIEFIRIFPDTGPTQAWIDLPCSFLELMVGLSRRLSFEAGGSVGEWFWELIRNLGIDDITDARYPLVSPQRIDEILNRVIFRLYARNGSGGFFPLTYPELDQTEVEIWYQLSAYLLERSA